MNDKCILFIFDGEIEESEKRGLSGLDRVRTEHIDELCNRRRKVSAIALRSLTEASNLFSSFNFRRRIDLQRTILYHQVQELNLII